MQDMHYVGKACYGRLDENLRGKIELGQGFLDSGYTRLTVSVLERTKEIGILRSLGARKKDITHVFDAETFILGLCSGLLGVAIAWLLTFPINSIIASMASLENVAHLQPLHALILVAISTILTMLGGHIPARMASRKDAVEALRSE